MARTLRSLRSVAKALGGLLPLGLVWGLPLAAGLAATLPTGFDESAWVALFAHPQLWPALLLSLATGSASLAASTLLALWIVAGLYGTKIWPTSQSLMGGFLALPHLAFAIGFGFLIMPSGLLARLLGSPLGWSEPPAWVTTQDPLGLSLIAALVLKEAPFVVWLVASLLARPDFAQILKQQMRVAQSLGHGGASIWLRLFIPQILARLKWPLLVVWVYGASVVDMALAIGPTQPPTLAVIIWADLNNVDAAINARGTVGAHFLTLALAAIALGFWLTVKSSMPKILGFIIAGPDGKTVPQKTALALTVLLPVIYGAVLALLAIMSIASYWPFPDLWPEAFRLAAWSQALKSPTPLVNSLALALVSAVAALAFAVSWLEMIAERFDGCVLFAAIAALAFPSLLIADGQYLAFLNLGLNGTWAGVFLGQFTPVFAYAFIVLKGPYRAFDPRFRSVALGLNASALRFWAQVKLPLLKPVLASAAAIGVGVSIAQYVAVQLISGGRHPTLTTEAVTLASGGSRQLLAVFSLMLMATPLIAFAAANSARKPLS
jgi:putative thiamine transport system permease protein